jgi:hypothetical protein
MWHKAQAQPSQRLARQVLVPFQILLCQRVKEGRCMRYPMPKVGKAMKLGRLATLASWPACQVGPQAHIRPKHQLKPPINTAVLLPAKSLKKVRFSFV